MLRLSLAIAALTVPTAAITAPPVTSAATYVKKAGASDQYEIQSSRLVMGSRDHRVSDFARQMIRDHTKSTADVKAAAMRSHVRVGPPVLEPMQARMIAQLRRTPMARRDALYISQQKQAHRMALTLHQGFARNGNAAPLRDVAGQIVPVVRSHLDMLNHM